jgi:hypothetical protein
MHVDYRTLFRALYMCFIEFLRKNNSWGHIHAAGRLKRDKSPTNSPSIKEFDKI